MKRLLAGAAFALALACPGLALANPGFVPAPVALLAGPDSNYPFVVTIPGNATVNIMGCLSDLGWCDVAWGAYRGWMPGAYLRSSWNGGYYTLYQAPPPPVVVFDFGSYWDRFYLSFPFYGNRDHWRPAPNPSPGPRYQPHPQPDRDYRDGGGNGNGRGNAYGHGNGNGNRNDGPGGPGNDWGRGGPPR